MGRICDTVKGSCQRKYVIKGDGSGVDEEVFHSSGIPVSLIHDLLFPEDVLTVWNRQQFFVYKGIKREGILECRKQADHVDFFLCREFHARYYSHAVFFAVVHGGRTVPARIVIREGDHVQSFDCGHPDDIGGGHVIVPAGGEAGVDMKVIIERDHGAPAS